MEAQNSATEEVVVKNKGRDDITISLPTFGDLRTAQEWLDEAMQSELGSDIMRRALVGGLRQQARNHATAGRGTDYTNLAAFIAAQQAANAQLANRGAALAERREAVEKFRDWLTTSTKVAESAAMVLCKGLTDNDVILAIESSKRREAIKSIYLAYAEQHAEQLSATAANMFASAIEACAGLEVSDADFSL